MPYREAAELPRLLTLEELTKKIGEGAIGGGEAAKALALIVAREQLGAAATEAQVEGFAREMAALLDGDPTLEGLLRP